MQDDLIEFSDSSLTFLSVTVCAFAERKKGLIINFVWLQRRVFGAWEKMVEKPTKQGGIMPTKIRFFPWIPYKNPILKEHHYILLLMFLFCFPASILLASPYVWVHQDRWRKTQCWYSNLLLWSDRQTDSPPLLNPPPPSSSLRIGLSNFSRERRSTSQMEKQKRRRRRRASPPTPFSASKAIYMHERAPATQWNLLQTPIKKTDFV